MPGGKKGRFKIGRYPTVDLKTAQTEARRIVALVAQGIDPQEERRLAKQDEQTVGDLIALFQRDYLASEWAEVSGSAEPVLQKRCVTCARQGAFVSA